MNSFQHNETLARDHVSGEAAATAGPGAEQGQTGDAGRAFECWAVVGGKAIYSINPTTEELARGVAQRCSAEPVHRFQLPAPEEKEDEYEMEDRP